MTTSSWNGTFFFDIKFSMITKDNFIGSIEEDMNAIKENVVCKDIVQDKYTIYGEFFELD